MPTLHISHPAFSGHRREETVHFYRDLLGMPVVLLQDNLDVPAEDHFFFDAGGDTFIAYFLPKPGAAPGHTKPARSGWGWMDHLALDVDPASLEGTRQRLVAEGVEVDGPVDRGYERSIYFRDPNGVTVELLAWLTPVPAGLRQADVIRRAQELREARGSRLVEDEDVRAAITALRG
jgi:catechol 2,3-dioxygenase-like lactoylglutathione lyase family enzyme